MDRKKALKKLNILKKEIKNCRFELIQNSLLTLGFEESQPSKDQVIINILKASILL